MSDRNIWRLYKHFLIFCFHRLRRNLHLLIFKCNFWGRYYFNVIPASNHPLKNLECAMSINKQLDRPSYCDKYCLKLIYFMNINYSHDQCSNQDKNIEESLFYLQGHYALVTKIHVSYFICTVSLFYCNILVYYCFDAENKSVEAHHYV